MFDEIVVRIDGPYEEAVERFVKARPDGVLKLVIQTGDDDDRDLLGNPVDKHTWAVWCHGRLTVVAVRHVSEWFRFFQPGLAKLIYSYIVRTANAIPDRVSEYTHPSIVHARSIPDQVIHEWVLEHAISSGV